MIEPRKTDAPLYCPRCGGPCDVEIDEIRGRLAAWTEPFVFCLDCAFTSELGEEGVLIDARGGLRLDELQVQGVSFMEPRDFMVRLPVRTRTDS